MKKENTTQTGERTQHTPGPWQQNPTGDVGWWLVGTSSVPVAETLNECCSQDESAANARLIAAAPELLEALKAMRRELKACANDCMTEAKSMKWIDDNETDIQAREAIAKAEGK